MGSSDMMAQTELSRVNATTFIEAFSARQFSTIDSLFAPEASYWVNGNPSKFPWSGTAPAAERMQMVPVMMNAFGTFDVTIRSIVADGRKAIAEFGLWAQEPGEKGLVYSNDVVMIFQFDESGKIASLREYIDGTQSLAYFTAKQAAQKAD